MIWIIKLWTTEEARRRLRLAWRRLNIIIVYDAQLHVCVYVRNLLPVGLLWYGETCGLVGWGEAGCGGLFSCNKEEYRGALWLSTNRPNKSNSPGPNEYSGYSSLCFHESVTVGLMWSSLLYIMLGRDL